MTTNSFGGVTFDGVCTDYSNAAYPVEKIRRMIAPEVEERYRNTAVHLALSLIDVGLLEWNENKERYVVTQKKHQPCNGVCGRDADQVDGEQKTTSPETKTEFVEEACVRLDVSVSRENSFLRFLELLESVLSGLTAGEKSVL